MVSVIIPTYNDEKFISKCLESVILQTYKDIEIIIVIDGATDGTESIVYQYADRDRRIKVIVQANAGAGPARNSGLKMVRGEYIVFVDADDWLNPDAIEMLVNEADRRNSDFIVAGTASVEYFKGKYNISENIPEYLHVEGVRNVRNECFKLFINGMGHGPVGKLYRSSIIHKYSILFPDIRKSEDIMFNNIYFGYIKSLTVLNACIYNFRNPSYPEPSQKMKSSRRYDKKYIKAQNNYFETILLLDDDIRNRLKKWGIEITEPMETALSNKLVIEIDNLLEPILARDYKLAYNLLGSVLGESRIENALDKSRMSNPYHYVFAGLCKLHFRNPVLLIILFKIKIRKYLPGLMIAMRRE